MSIIANKIRVEGNSIYITSTPQSGIIALTSFVDDVAGIDGTHTVSKSFRYSLDGVIFSDWFPLTVNAITSISISQKDIIYIELQYALTQPSGSNNITVSQATIGTTDLPNAPGQYFKNSIFSQFFSSDDPQVLNWMVNVLEKLYAGNLLPQYMSNLNSQGKPDDFLEYWGSVCKFFAYYVVYARTYQNFYNNKFLLNEYLEEKGIATSPLNTLPELQLLMAKFNNQVSKRGTIHIVDKSDNGAQIDGELLRLINYNKITDEFIFNFNRQKHFSWNLNNASPLFRGLTFHDNANKYVTAGQKIKVSEYMDYELSFQIQKPAGNDFSVGFDAFDKDLNPINLKARADGSNQNYFFQNIDLQRSDKFITIKLFLFNKLKPVNIKGGNSLKMINGVVWVTPKITGPGTIQNIRLTPLCTPNSKGYIGVEHFIDLWIKNNNNRFSFYGIKQYFIKYLKPYNTEFAMYDVETSGDYSNEETIIQPLKIVTNPASSLTINSAVLGGNVLGNGGSAITERGIVWFTNHNPTVINNKVAMGTGNGVFSATVNALPPGVTIYVKAYVINANGTFYANEVSFNSSVNIISINILGTDTYKKDSTVSFEVKFSQPITGLNIDNFAVDTDAAITGASIASISGSGNTWIVVVNTGLGDGRFTINMVNTYFVSPNISNLPSTLSENYIIDKTAPTVSITSQPPSTATSGVANFSFDGVDSGSGLAGFEVSIDGGAYVASTSPKMYTGLSNGSHTFNVRAIDNVGNVSAPVSYTWTVAVHTFNASWGWASTQFGPASTDTGSIVALPEVGRTVGHPWLQQFQLSGVPQINGSFLIVVYGINLQHVVAPGDTLASIVVDLANKINALNIHPVGGLPLTITSVPDGSDPTKLNIIFDYQHSAFASYTPTPVTNVTGFAWQGTGVFSSDIIADFRLAPPNSYLAVEYDNTEPTKSAYYNSPLYNGLIPGPMFITFTVGSKKYIASKVITNLDHSQTTGFSA